MDGFGPLHVADADLERVHRDLLAAADRVDEFFLDAMRRLLLARIRELGERLIAAAAREDALLVVDVDRAFAAEDPDLVAAREPRRLAELHVDRRAVGELVEHLDVIGNRRRALPALARRGASGCGRASSP